MRMRGSISLATAIVLMGICGFSVAQGWTIVRFSLAKMKVESPESREEIAKRWGATPGVASTALRTTLADKINIADQKANNRQRETLSEILAIKPLSSRDWLALSGLQLITDQPMDDVLESLKLSMLTAPNEGYIMVERGVYGVSLWGSLSPDLKSRVANDLVPVLFPRTAQEGADAGKLRALVSAQSQRVRRELREALLATGLSPTRLSKNWAFRRGQRLACSQIVLARALFEGW